MRRFRVRTSAAAVLAAAALSGLAMPGQAQAASPTAEVRVCNKYRALDSVYMSGKDANGNTKEGWMGAPNNNCSPYRTMAQGQTLTIWLDWVNYQSVTFEKCYIKTGYSNGTKLTCNYYY